jgi:RimJ/RimL family protein N-acetyltransferase
MENISINFPFEIDYSDNDFILKIRTPVESDASSMYEALILSLNCLREFLPWAHGIISENDQLERIRNANKNPNRKEVDIIVVDGITNKFLMAGGWRLGRTPNKRAVDLGYWTPLINQNMGLATILTKILVVIALDYLNYDRVEIGCNKANKGSYKVIQKCGFQLEGELKNYFDCPSQTMLNQGLNPERTSLIFSLVPENIHNLGWYQHVKNSITINKLV